MHKCMRDTSYVINLHILLVLLHSCVRTIIIVTQRVISTSPHMVCFLWWEIIMLCCYFMPLHHHPRHTCQAHHYRNIATITLIIFIILLHRYRWIIITARIAEMWVQLKCTILRIDFCVVRASHSNTKFTSN